MNIGKKACQNKTTYVFTVPWKLNHHEMTYRQDRWFGDNMTVGITFCNDLLITSVPETRCFSDSMTLVMGLRWTVKVWKSCGPWPTVSGCCTITRIVPALVPYAISIQLPLRPGGSTAVHASHRQQTGGEGEGEGEAKQSRQLVSSSNSSIWDFVLLLQDALSSRSKLQPLSDMVS